MRKIYIAPETELILVKQEQLLGVLSQIEGEDVTGGGTKTPGMGGGGSTPPAPGAKSFAWSWEYDEKN